ncbi:AAA family ATPase, partial [Persephonella sp.]|uniref:AAA family ATPase n=1 Tax=Persephonella sp. TaxID=2060922 RepID=UPI00260A7F89
MILKRVRLRNFLAHDDTEIEFSPSGITVFIGENGAGKSSIIEGIVYGIFGKTDRGKLEDLVKWGKREATVEVEFQKGNSEYKVERTITIRGNKGSSTGVIYKKEKGKYRPYYQKHISREIPKITGISYKTFLSSVLVKQGDIEGLIELSPKDRAKIFEDLLDMSLYQLIAENIATKRKVLQEQVKWLEKETEQLKELETQTEKLQEQLESLKTQQEEKQKELKQLNEEQTKLQKQIDLLQSEKEKLIKTKAHIEKLQEVINISHKNLKSLEEKIQHINKEKEKLPHLKKQVENLKQL